MTIATSTRLADGRELIYFDDGAHAKSHSAHDTRPLDARSEENTGELRYDALTGDWVAVAAHRQTRTYLPLPTSARCVPPPGRTCPRFPIPPTTWPFLKTVSRRWARPWAPSRQTQLGAPWAEPSAGAR